MLKILIIKRGAIGDLLMATPLIRQLKTRLDCKLDILVGKDAAVAIKDNPYLAKRYILPDKSFALSGFLHLARFLCKFYKRYDYVFVLDKHWYFNLIAKFTGAKVIGFCREWISSFLLYKKVIYKNVERYHGLYYLDMLQASNLAQANYDDIGLDLTITTNDQRIVTKLLTKYNIQNFMVVVNSGGNNSYEQTGIRMLPEDKIVDLLHELLNGGKTIIMLGGNTDLDNYVRYIKKLDNHSRLFNFAGQLSLSQSAYLIRQAVMLYTTDCGAMHLGVINNMPQRMLAFFGPTNPQHILPANYIYTSAVWQDQDIYDKNYQLTGNLRQAEPQYFTKLNVTNL